MPPPPLEPVSPHPVPRYLNLRLLLGLNLFPQDSATHLLSPLPLPVAVAAALCAEPAPPAGEVCAQSPPQPPGRQTQHQAPPRCHKHPVAHPLLTHQVLGMPYHCVCFTDKEAQATRVASKPGAG